MILYLPKKSSLFLELCDGGDIWLANSVLISDLKTAIAKELVKDESLFYAIDSHEITDFKQANKLMYSHIFPYHRITETITETNTYITFQVHIREMSSWNKKWVAAILEFYIYSHDKHMKVNNIPKVTDNRNDYIAKLLDNKFNGRSSFGNNKDPKNDVHLYDDLSLTLNEEGATQQGFLYRHMAFKTKDLNNSACDQEWR